MSGLRSVFLGVSGSTLLSATRALSGLLLTPLYFAHLGPQALGGWMLFSGLGGFVLMWDLGLSMLASRAFAYHLGARARGASLDASLGPALAAAKPQDLRVTLGRAYAGLALGLWALAAGLGSWYLGTLDLGEAVHELRLAWVLYAAGLCVILGGSLSNYLLQGCGDVGLEAGLQVLGLLANLGLSALALGQGAGPWVLGLLFFIQALFTRFMAAQLARRRHAWLFEPGENQPALRAELGRQVLPLLASRLGALAIFQATPVLIASKLGSLSVPGWVATQTMALYGGVLLAALPQALGPWVAAKRAQGDDQAIRRALLLALKLGVGLALLYALCLSLWGTELMGFWLGPAHVTPLLLLASLAMIYAAEFHLQTLAQFVFSAGHWPFAKPALLAGALNILLAYLWLPQLGLLGGALALGLAQLLGNHLASLLIARERLGLSLGAYLRGAFLPLLGLGLGAGSLGWALRLGLRQFQWPELHWGSRALAPALPALLGSALLLSLGSLAIFFLALNREERALFTRARQRQA